MTLKDPVRTGLLALAMLCASSHGVADPRLTAAEACTEEANRLERLACFDEVFATPLARYQPGAGEPRMNRSERWRQAFALAGKGDVSGVIYRNTGATAGHLVTVTALGAKPPRPVLTLQCYNNITELAVMLPEPINRERANVALGAERALWRVGGEGVGVRGGRGLPAIGTGLGMGWGPGSRVQADVGEMGGPVVCLNRYA